MPLKRPIFGAKILKKVPFLSHVGQGWDMQTIENKEVDPFVPCPTKKLIIFTCNEPFLTSL